MSNTVADIKDVVQVLNSAVEFYSTAKNEIDDYEINRVLDSQIASKNLAINKLQTHIVNHDGEAETGNAWSTKAREMYTKIAGSLSSNSIHTYIDQLEEVEDQILEAIDDAIKNADQPALKTDLTTIRSNMQSSHDQMLALQKSTA